MAAAEQQFHLEKVLLEERLHELLDPRRMTEPGLTAGPSGG
jgi:hypothetical protein